MLDAVILVAFLALLLAIGRWASSRVHTSLDFHLCGRRQLPTEEREWRSTTGKPMSAWEYHGHDRKDGEAG